MPRLSVLLALLGALVVRQAAAEPCNITFFDAIHGADSDTWLFEQGLGLAGAKDKLPDPNALPVTILVPSDRAWFDFLVSNGFLLGNLGDLGGKLTSLMTYHIMPTALSPEQLAVEGKVPTVYGLLTGQDKPLTHYAKFDDPGYLLFMGDDHPGAAASGVKERIQVCNSWVYIVDTVLMPTSDLGDVAAVDISGLDKLGGGGGGGSTPSPTPSPSPTPAPEGGAVAPPAVPAVQQCDKTFAQVAGETSGLSLLKTVVSQAQFSSALPDPSGNYTLFAPTDAAFFGLLSAFNLSITDVLALGDKLTAVLLYHVAPGSLTPEQLAKETKLTTGLAVKTGDAAYMLGVSTTADGKTTVSGVYPGNTANIVQTLAVCGSNVYVVDEVLIPAASLDAIPKMTGGLDAVPRVPAESIASPTPAPASPAPAPAAESAATAPPAAAGSTSVSGVALATGYLAGCSVQLVREGVAEKVTSTDSSGRFSFDCGADCSSLGAVLRLPATDQPEGCADSLTKLAPAFDTQAALSALPEGVTEPLALSPLTTIIAAASAQPAAPAPAAPSPSGAARKLLQGSGAQPAEGKPAGGAKPELDFAITEAAPGAPATNVSTEYGDLLQASLEKDLIAFKLMASNQELICTGAVGGSLLSALVGGDSTSAADASAALFDELAKDLLAGSPFNLTDAASVVSFMERALAALVARAADGTPSTVDSKAVEAAAAGTITLLNGLLEQASAAAEADGMAAGGDKMVQVLARLAKVCQADVAPAATQLAKGQLSVEAFNEQFTLEKIRDLAVNTTL